MKTMQELAKDAMQVQDACNLSGVVHGWSRAMKDLIQNLRDSGQYTGTDQINSHPINRMWASKVHDLTGLGLSDTKTFSDAFDEVLTLIEGESVK